MKYILILFFTLTFFADNSQALMPRRHKWLKLKTPHFTVVAPKAHKAFAHETAKEAERAYETLKSITTQFPKNTIIIIDPTKDYSNGQATFFPYATITLQPAAPSPDTSIGQYNSWLYELLLHEYTHILSFHNHRGAYRPLRWLLGSTISPGYFLPVWYLEGFAVYTESKFTDGGRLKTARYKYMKEEFSKKSSKIHISNINEQDLPLFPHGQNPYFFGGILNDEMLKTQKDSKNIHKKFSGRIPFFIPSAYKSVTKKSIFKTWKSFFKKSAKTTSFDKKLIGENPKIINNKVYFIGQDDYQTDNISSFDIATNKTQTIASTYRNITQFKTLGEDIYFLSTQERDDEYLVFELFKVKTNKYNQKPNTPITKKLHARHFDILENKLIFSKINISGDSLNIADLNNIDKSKSIVYKPLKRSRITFTYFINSDEIIFAEKTDGSDETVYKYNISTKLKTPIFSAQHINYISPSKKSFYILSEKNGIKTLSLLSNGESRSISNGLLSFDISNESLWGSLITTSGPVIQKIESKGLSASTFKTAQTNRYPASSKQSDGIKSQENNKFEIQEKKYSSFNKLKPHYITPNFVLSPYGFSGESLYGFSTGSSDPLKLNQYSVNIFTDSITKEVSGNLNYLSNHTRLPINFAAGKFYEPINLVDIRDSSYAQLSTNIKLSQNSDLGWSVGGGFLWDETNFNAIKANRGGLNLNFSYTSTRQRLRELAPQSGMQFSISNNYFAELEDSYTSYFSVNSSFRKFLKAPFFKSHRILLGADVFWANDLLLQNYAPISRNNPLTSGFTLRGIPTGAIQASELYSVGHFEYKFPILRLDWGPGLWPIFLKRATGSIVSDFGVVNGFDRIRGASLGTDELLISAGVEFTLETKISYHAPLNFQFGIYNFLNKDFYDADPEIFVGVNLAGFPF